MISSQNVLLRCQFYICAFNTSDQLLRINFTVLGVKFSFLISHDFGGIQNCFSALALGCNMPTVRIYIPLCNYINFVSLSLFAREKTLIPPL